MLSKLNCKKHDLHYDATSFKVQGKHHNYWGMKSRAVQQSKTINYYVRDGIRSKNHEFPYKTTRLLHKNEWLNAVSKIHAGDNIKPAGSGFVSESSSIITVIRSVLVDCCLA